MKCHINVSLFGGSRRLKKQVGSRLCKNTSSRVFLEEFLRKIGGGQGKCEKNAVTRRHKGASVPTRRGSTDFLRRNISFLLFSSGALILWDGTTCFGAHLTFPPKCEQLPLCETEIRARATRFQEGKRAKRREMVLYGKRGKKDALGGKMRSKCKKTVKIRLFVQKVEA